MGIPTSMFTNLTPLKSISGLAFAFNLVLLFGLGEYPQQINDASDMIATLAVVDINSWNLQILILFEYAMYGLLFVLLASYVLIFFDFKFGRWILLFSMLAALPMPLITGGIVSTMAEVPLEVVISMLDGCLIYLLFFTKKHKLSQT